MASSKLFAGNASGLWTSVGNIKGTNDGTTAYAVLAASGNSVVVLVNTYGFSIPAGATIDGIEVVVYCKGGATNKIRDATAALKCGGVTSSDRAVSTYWPSAAIGTIVHGGPADKWGLTPAGSDINSSTFEFDLSAHNDGISSKYAYVDAISIEVFYTEASQGGTATPSGVAASGSVGAPTGKGGASVLPSGVQAVGSVGAAVGKGGAAAGPLGVSATAAVGTPVGHGAASVSPPGVAALGYVGQPVATGGTGEARAYPQGVAAVGSVGQAVARGDAVASPPGVGAVAAVGSPVGSGGASARPAGASAHGSVGQVLGHGGATAHPGGVSGAGSVGAPVVYVYNPLPNDLLFIVEVCGRSQSLALPLYIGGRIGPMDLEGAAETGVLASAAGATVGSAGDWARTDTAVFFE